ncbi:MAG: hypothetical protein A3G43_05440 [Ignavibacteria bacterium RIFCSPLOWO2_12_FULL_56_21]|nr:MAG: hypothetical protein A3C56_10015 [Ignavibacteria bacterium RIFCSPHIGHO2_02_FULL_56_12]OGU75235.1 MAG: hypothetical protein A3G43_05440 [Ignavibacteria bacterium RIFCSPLOWO2_12_FULL_56_21]
MQSYLRCLFIFIVLFIPASAQQGSKNFTVQELYGSSTFSGRIFGGSRWLNDGRRFITTETDTSTKMVNLVSVDAATGTRKLFLDGSFLKSTPDAKPVRIGAFRLSADESKVLLAGPPPEKQYLSRLTPAGNLYVYDVPQKTFQQITNVDVEQWNQKFTPDGKGVAVVRNNDIYYIDVAAGTERRLTNDGSENIMNGKFDWVYEEEFGISDGMQFSPDGKRMAYWRLDQTRVPEFNMVDHAGMRGSSMRMKYPKAGDANAIVRVCIHDFSTGATSTVDIGTNDDTYVPRIFWQPDSKRLLVARLNRAQTKLEYLAADPATGATTVLFTEESKVWIEEGYGLTAAGGGRWLYVSDRDGFSHVYLLDVDLKVLRQVTKGAWDVGSINAVDEKRGIVYFSASMKTPIESQVYAITLNGTGQRQLTTDGFNHSINISPTAEFAVDSYSSITTPSKTALITMDGKRVRMMEENPMAMLKDYAMGETSFFQFTTTDGVSLNGYMIKPVAFDASKQYPVLFTVYGGPGSQTVRNAWGGTNYLWHQMLAQHGYMIVSVDGRGTGARGRDFKTITYKHLGKWEVNDQIEAAKYLATLPYVDKSRIGIWGWSYGGYMSALTLLKGAEQFKTAIAVAPVTHWKFYDTIYTERFMGTPQENPEGYAESAPATHAGLLKGNLLVVHGTTDDNVHWQNTTQFVDALQKAGKQFRTMFYVNKNHGIGGGTTRVHLFQMLTDYLLEKL